MLTVVNRLHAYTLSATRANLAGEPCVGIASSVVTWMKPSPAKFAVVADKVDAWNRFTNVSIGAVYLRLVDGVPKALHTICPHLGCFVDYRQGKNDFFCPCHNSNFKLDGSLAEGVSPRAMDVLKIDVRNEHEVWVKFQNFQPGHSHKVPVS